MGRFAKSRLGPRGPAAHSPQPSLDSPQFFVQFFCPGLQTTGPLGRGPAFSETPDWVHFNFAAEDANKPELECQNVE